MLVLRLCGLLSKQGYLQWQFIPCCRWLHPAANLPHSAASATIQEPSPFVRKRLRKETTVPRYELGLAHWRMRQPELIVWHRCLIAKSFSHGRTSLLYGCSYDMLLCACFQNAAFKQCRSIPCCNVISSAVFMFCPVRA